MMSGGLLPFPGRKLSHERGEAVTWMGKGNNRNCLYNWKSPVFPCINTLYQREGGRASLTVARPFKENRTKPGINLT